MSEPIEVDGNRKCRKSGALCATCAGLIRMHERELHVVGYGWMHKACVRKLRDLSATEAPEPEKADPELSWSEVYRVPDVSTEQRKREFAAWLAVNGQPVHGR